MKLLNKLFISICIPLAVTAQANSFKTEKWTTANGVKVVFYKAMEVPMLDISLAFAAGSAYDEQHYGLSALTSRMLNEGSAGRDASTIADALADTGAQFDAASSRDMTVLNLRTLTSEPALTEATTTFAQIINQPDFQEDAFIREQQQVLMSIKQAAQSPDEVASINFFQNLYKEHPYAHPVSGTEVTIKAITTEQVRAFYKKYYVANNATLVLVGAIDSATAHKLADKLTKALASGTTATVIAKARPLSGAETIAIPFPSSQTVLRLGQIGIDHRHAEYFPLIVGNYILGGGALVSRLAVEVREKKGLTYGVDSQFVPMPGEGPFLISLSTRSEKANTALDITKNTLNQFISDGPNEQELHAAKQYLTGSFPMSLASNRTIANLLLRMAFYKLPNNYLDNYVNKINAVTHEQIKQAFKHQVDPDKLLLIRVGQS